MKYAWASITLNTCNYGNYLIEDALKKILDLPAPEFVFDSFSLLTKKEINKINKTCDLVISPGCTTLQPGQNKAYESFDQFNIPTPSFGGAVWSHGEISQLGLYKKMFSLFPKYQTVSISGEYQIESKDAQKLSSIAKKHSQPVGCRDPYTFQLLSKENIESRFIGCPTLLDLTSTNTWKPMQARKLVFSFSRNNILNQIYIINKLSKKWDVHVVIHEPYEEKFLKFIKVKNIIRFETSDQFFGAYADADLVLTGRLHGALPALRACNRVIFFGNPADTRLSILEWLGVTIHPLSRALINLDKFEEFQNPSNKILNRIDTLKERFSEYSKSYSVNTMI